MDYVGDLLRDKETSQFQAEVVRYFNVNQNVVSGIWNQFQKTKTTFKRPITGCQIATTRQDDWYFSLTAIEGQLFYSYMSTPLLWILQFLGKLFTEGLMREAIMTGDEWSAYHLLWAIGELACTSEGNIILGHGCSGQCSLLLVNPDSV